jgi:tetratricopeptide (TPR) repeat protein
MLHWKADQALADCDRDLEHSPDSSAIHLNRVLLLHRLGRDEEATKELGIVEALVKQAEPLNALCWDLAGEGMLLERALADCDASLRLDPHAVATLDSRGFVLYRLGRFPEALQAYDAALAVDPEEYHSIFGRGLVEARLGKDDASRVDIRTAETARPYIRAEFEDMGVK